MVHSSKSKVIIQLYTGTLQNKKPQAQPEAFCFNCLLLHQIAQHRVQDAAVAVVESNLLTSLDLFQYFLCIDLAPVIAHLFAHLQRALGFGFCRRQTVDHR